MPIKKTIFTVTAMLLIPAQALALDAETWWSLIDDPQYGEYTRNDESGKAYQQGWYEYLRQETGLDRDRLSHLLAYGEQPYFDRSCYQPEYADDFKKLRDTMAEILLSGVPGHPAGKGEPGDRGRYLACLSNSGLGGVEGILEHSVAALIRPPRQALRPGLVCEFKKEIPHRGAFASTWQYGKQITWRSHQGLLESAGVDMSGAYGSPDLKGVEIEATFGNILFHELVHVGGVGQELLTQTATACCGDEVSNRAQACVALDKAVQRASNVWDLAKELDRFTSFMDPPFEFEQKDAQRFASFFYSGLLETMPQLMTRQMRDDCVRTNGRENCAQQASAAIQATLQDLMKPEGICWSILSGRAWNICKAFKPADYDRAVDRLVYALLPDPSRKTLWWRIPVPANLK